MQIKTKYDIDETVFWISKQGTPYKARVKRIDISVIATRTVTLYEMNNNTASVEESNLFPNKEELAKSVSNKVLTSL